MWISLFAIVIAVAICLSVTAFMMMYDGGIQETSNLPLENSASAADGGRQDSYKTSSKKEFLKTEPPEFDLYMLLADPEVRSMMRADHIGEREMMDELNAISIQIRKNANSMFGFDRAVCRLQNMAEMIDRLGFDAEALACERFDVRSVFDACQVCPADEVCHDWLARAAKSLDQAPAFCLNAEQFRVQKTGGISLRDEHNQRASTGVLALSSLSPKFNVVGQQH